MNRQNKYSIGDVSQICNISKKALRYYDKIGLITSQRQDYNNYRYYTRESLLAVPVIKYYKQMGFKLEEMREFIEGDMANVYRTIRNSFLAKIKELEEEQEEIRRKYISVKDWHDLIQEAEMVIDNNIQEVSIKYVEPSNYLFLEQHYSADIKSAIINIDFTNYVESLANEITGPVILNFPSHEARMKDHEQTIRIVQKSLMPCDADNSMTIGGHMMVSCYHIGPHKTIADTYKKIRRWVRHHGYSISDESYERYVTDYWTTRNDTKFVTEVMLKASRQPAVSME